MLPQRKIAFLFSGIVLVISITYVRIIKTVEASLFNLQDTSLSLNEIVWQPEKSHIYIGSPSIIRLKSGILVASADRFGDGFKGARRNTSIYHSYDDGQSWNFTCWVKDQYWSNIFQIHIPFDSKRNQDMHIAKAKLNNAKDGALVEDKNLEDENNNVLYLLGTETDGPAPIKISKSSDGGMTWPETTILFGEVEGNSSYETGPTPALINNGIIYRAMERMAPPDFRWPQDYESVVIYSNISSNLMDRNNWKMSKALPFDINWIPKDWFPKPTSPGYLEGNMIEGPTSSDGVYNLIRFNTRPYDGNKAILLKYDPKQNSFVFDSIVDFPGGHSKFVIHRDPKTLRYVTLSNPQKNKLAEDQRNILSLCSSNDMRTWIEHAVILKDDTGFTPFDSIRYTGFHYVDWQFDGKDFENIIMTVRTAYRGSVSYHNSNRITFSKINNWRDILKQELH